MIDQNAAMKIQPELMSGETLQWAGMPNPRVIFHIEDWFQIPFGLVWTVFMIFWESSALGYWGTSSRHNSPPVFFALWGIPFLLIGQYLIWGRFVYDGWLKRRTYYAVTNRRILVLQEGWKRQTSTMYLESIPSIQKDGGTAGSLWFGEKPPVFAGRGRKSRSSRFSMGATPVFADIDDAEAVQRLVMDLREKITKAPLDAPSPFSLR
jgi:hypothetical protein